MLKYTPFIAAIIFLTACSGDKPDSTAELKSEKQIPGFASGSGMTRLGGKYFAAGDDDAYLHILNEGGDVLEKHRLWDTANVVEGRILKSVKPDFEALAAFPFDGDTALIIFGSGSKSPRRDVVMTARPNSLADAARLPADTAFFAWLRGAAGLGIKELNLEGAAYRNGELILLNRHNNELYRIPEKGFRSFLTSGTTDVLSLERRRFILPAIGSDSARFSGASVLPDGSALLFSASVEVTSNAIDDGTVKGSFVGTIDLDGVGNAPLTCARIMRPDGSPFRGKTEAAEGRRNPDGSVSVIGITDNDDGTTYLVKIELNPGEQ